MAKTKSNLREAYSRQKYSAKKRGIEWKFTFDTWLDVWDESGHLHERGSGADEYCMARTNDVGPYSPENVRITTNIDNQKEAGEVVAARWAFMLSPVSHTWKRPTGRQRQVISMISTFQRDNGMPPTFAEIAKCFGWKSANAAVEHIRALEKKGLIRRVPGVARGVKLTDAASRFLGAA